VQNWFASYLEGRLQFVRCGSENRLHSPTTTVLVGRPIPHGVILIGLSYDPFLYTADLLIKTNGLYGHISMHTTPRSMASVVRVTLPSYKVACLRALEASDCGCGPTGCNSTWRKLMFCGVDYVSWSTAADDSLLVSVDTVQPVRSVGDHCIHLHLDILMRTHVTRTVSSCLAVLRQIYRVSRPDRASQSIGRTVARRVILFILHSKFEGAALVSLVCGICEQPPSTQSTPQSKTNVMLETNKCFCTANHSRCSLCPSLLHLLLILIETH